MRAFIILTELNFFNIVIDFGLHIDFSNGGNISFVDLHYIYMSKLKLFIPLICFLFLGLAGIGLTQEQIPPADEPTGVGGGYSPVISGAVNLDENIKPEDLGVGDPNILPDSPLYAFKNIGRGFQSFFTRDPVKKAELKLKFANEKIIEAKKMAEKTDRPELLHQTLDNYLVETDRLKEAVEKIKETAKENIEVDKFLDKFVDHNIKQQKLIGKLEKELPAEVYDKIRAVKEENLAKFSDIALKMAPPETLQQKLTENIEQQSGSQFKNFKNLEILKEIEEKVPEPAKEAIKKAQENSFKRLQNDMEKMASEDREKFDDYVKNIGGNEVRHMEIIHEFETRVIPEIVREEMEKAKERAFERIEKKMKEFKIEKQKEEFLQHLEKGEMEDLRIIKELENNLAPETIDKILEVKNRAMGNFKDGFEKADTLEQQEGFFKELEKFHDVKQFEMFKEMDNIIPEDKKEFWEKMKKMAMEEMQRDIAMAEDMEEKKRQYERLAGDSPEHIKIIQEFGPPPEIMTEILKEQAEILSRKIENVEDAARLQFLKQKIEGEEMIEKELKARNPQLFEKIDEHQKIFHEQITKEGAVQQIEKAKREIVAAETEFSSLDDKTKNEITERSPYRVLLANAQKKINVAQVALENELFGEAFGMGTAAFHEANNARRIIKEIGLRREIFEKQDAERRTFEEKFFKEEMEKREKVEKMFKEEFPDERIPLPGEFRIEFLPEDQILQPMMPFPSDQMQPEGQAPTVEGCACIMIWDPVCGKDGKTYGNACEAKCANIEIASKGSCGGEQKPSPMPGIPSGMIPSISTIPEFMECASDLSCPQPRCAEGTICPKFRCINGKCVMEREGFQKIEELPCSKAGEKVNRNPLLGPTHGKCCENLTEIRVSKSYSICEKEIRGEKPEWPERPTGERPSTGLANPASVYCKNLDYKLEIRTGPEGGQYGVCIFPDGTSCKDWEFYRGQCGRDKIDCYKFGGYCDQKCKEGDGVVYLRGCEGRQEVCCMPEKEGRARPIKCGWCGPVCAEYPLKDGQGCPAVMPAPGYQCVEENGKCVAKYTREEKPAYPEPRQPEKTEGLVCAQVLTYKKSGDQCYLCPDACSPIEKCKIAPPEKCIEHYIKEGMPPLPAREESPFQFFKETIEGIFRPKQPQPIQPQPMEMQKPPLMESPKPLEFELMEPMQQPMQPAQQPMQPMQPMP